MPDVEDASCVASLELTLSDGSTLDIDGCASWSVVAGVGHDPDQDPSITELSVVLNGVTGEGAECMVWIEQEGICGAGSYDLREEEHSGGAVVTTDCPGVADAQEGTYGVGSRYLRLDQLEAPELAQAASEDPVAMRVAGRLRAASASGVSITGDFSFGLTVPTEDIDATPTCQVTDGDDDGDGHVAAWFDGGDCDDSEPTVNPKAADTWYDGVDTDCGGGDDADATLRPDDGDGDGWSTCDGDCDDSAGDVYPYDPDGDGIDDACGWFAVGAGCQFSCAIDQRGLACWGIDDGNPTLDHGQVRDAQQRADVASVTAGMFHACALDWDGHVSCWGSDIWGQSSETPAVALTTVTAGRAHSCGLDTAGAVRCWGRDDLGQTSTAPGGTGVDLLGGEHHACLLDADRELECFGYGLSGSVTSPPSGAVSAVALGGYHGCAIGTDGALACWGYDDEGQVSDAP